MEKIINTFALMIFFCVMKMEKNNYVNNTDINFRLFILNLLNGRELSSVEVNNAVKRDFPSKQITKQRVDGLLKRLTLYSDLMRRRIDKQEQDRNDNCLYTFTLSNKGRKLKRHYLEKMNEN